MLRVMDILNSKILNIDGRLYIDYSEEENLPTRADFKELDRETSNNGAEIRGHEDQWCKDSVACPSALFKFVIGHRGDTKRRIEDETRTRIYLPPKGQHGDIVIRGKTPENVEAAKTRIQLLLEEKRWKEPFNYLVTIPLTETSLKEGFRDFKKQVLTKLGEDRGVIEKIFQSEDKLHLTIGTLVLLDESECQTAIEALKQIKSSLVSRFKGVKIRVRGVEYMNDDPEMVDVLYAKVSCPDNAGFLQELADYIVEEFASAGLMKKEHDHVKLHATVMNTIKTMEKNFNSRRGQKAPVKRDTFDARSILKMFESYIFGEFILKEIHISKRYTAGKNGYYESLFIADL